MKRLFIVGCFPYYAQRVLAAVYGLALVGIELDLNVGILELSVAPFADSKPRFHNSQFALRHDFSLAQQAGRT